MSYAFEPFVYNRLHDPGKEIRLCRLDGIDAASQPCLIMRTIKLQSSDEQTYAALSYTWGPEFPKRTVLLNGRTFDVRENLYHFLCNVQRYANDAVWIWIDQLCINQSDDHEKSEQVKRMAEIYDTASRVLVWLGPEADDSELAMALLEEWRAGCTKLFMPFQLLDFAQAFWARMDSRKLDAISKFWSRPYWARLWIVQEIMLARHVHFLCGTSVFAMETMEWQVLYDLFLPTTSKMRLTSERSGVRAAELVRECRNQAIKLDEGHQETNIGSLRLSAAIDITNGFECGDPRDRIFGVQALVRDDQKIGIDYSMSSREVFLATYKRLAAIEGAGRGARTMFGEDNLYRSMRLNHDPSILDEMKLFFRAIETDPVELANIDRTFGQGESRLPVQYVEYRASH